MSQVHVRPTVVETSATTGRLDGAGQAAHRDGHAWGAAGGSGAGSGPDGRSARRARMSPGVRAEVMRLAWQCCGSRLTVRSRPGWFARRASLSAPANPKEPPAGVLWCRASCGQRDRLDVSLVKRQRFLDLPRAPWPCRMRCRSQGSGDRRGTEDRVGGGGRGGGLGGGGVGGHRVAGAVDQRFGPSPGRGGDPRGIGGGVRGGCQRCRHDADGVQLLRGRRAGERCARLRPPGCRPRPHASAPACSRPDYMRRTKPMTLPRIPTCLA